MVNKITVGILFAILTGLLVGLAIMPEIGTQQATLTDKQDIVNETIDITTAYNASGYINITVSNFSVDQAPLNTWKEDDCPLESVSVNNGTVGLTENTDYIVYADAGIIQYLTTDATNESNIGAATNDTGVSYTFCPDGYIPDASGRSMAGLILIFTSLILIGFIIFYIQRNLDY